MCVINLKKSKRKRFYKVVIKYKGSYYGVYTGANFRKKGYNVAVNFMYKSKSVLELLLSGDPSRWHSPMITGFLDLDTANEYASAFSQISEGVRRNIGVILCQSKDSVWVGVISSNAHGHGMKAVCTERARFVKEVI
ncbi:hypothetical protein LCGC14_2134070 [marine sediment metagenome]|uniref:Uncharacterized protein n=1 Tax=marine sediment metagenome TaxID=412755 RepID=A0A0F9EMP0_9ZZZZ